MFGEQSGFDAEGHVLDAGVDPAVRDRRRIGERADHNAGLGGALTDIFHQGFDPLMSHLTGDPKRLREVVGTKKDGVDPVDTLEFVPQA